jgi:hypothetical protein
MVVALVGLVGLTDSVATASEAPLPSWPVSAAQATSQVTSQFAIADFDGDSRPDLATVQAGQSGSSDVRYWIRFQLSTGMHQIVGITAPTGGLQIASRDVNGDNFVDLVVTTAWTNRPVAVLLNDGRGDFTRSDPSAFPASIWTLERCWTRTVDEIRDAVVLPLARSFSGDCEGGSSASSPRSAIGVLAPWVSGNSSFSSIVPFLGRAPPALALHS